MHHLQRNDYRRLKVGSSFRILSFFVLLSIFWSNRAPTPLLYAQEIQSDDATPRVFLPYVSNFASDSTFREPPVALSPEEAAVEVLLRNYPGQQHPVLNLNSILTEQARRKAQDMADRNYFGHTDPEGFGPNHWVMAAGYALPTYYDTSAGANNIESIAAGQSTADEVWQAWMNSSGHRTHLLGEIDFYREQIDYGIGHVYKENSTYRNYWVILISKHS